MADDECAINKITPNDTFYRNEADDDEINFDDENTGTEITITQIVDTEIQLETPMESQRVSITTLSNAEASSIKPKRLSDEFSSIDEETGDINEEEEEENVKLSVTKCVDVACCSKSSSFIENDNDELDEENSSTPPFLCGKAETSSCISLCFSSTSNNLFVQSIDDAIERSDFEEEQKLTGGIIIRASSLPGEDDRLNFDLLNTRRSANSSDEIDPTPSVSQEIDISRNQNETSNSNVRSELTSTPTSSRCNVNDIRNKSTIRSSSAKQKLSDKYEYLSILKNVTVTTGSSMTDYDNGESSKCPDKIVDPNNEHSKRLSGGSNSGISSIAVDKSIKVNLFDDEPSTSSGGVARHHINNHLKDRDEETIDCLKLNDDYMDNTNHDLSDDLDPEDTWADCEDGGSDCEEICTCRNDSDDEYGASSSSSEDELPSRDVDLSSYTQLDPISDLHETGFDGTPKIQRKRKLTEQSILHVTSESPITSGGNRKRLALDSISSPHSNILSPISGQNLATPKSSSSLLSEKRTPRLIPTKENPPPELMD